MTTCLHCGRAIEPDDGGRIWYHPDTMTARCDGPDDEEGIGWGDMVRQAEPSTPDHGYIHEGPSKPCLTCAAVGRLTWQDPDGECRRADRH